MGIGAVQRTEMLVFENQGRRANVATQTIDEDKMNQSGKCSVTTRDIPSLGGKRKAENLQVHGDIPLRFHFNEGEPIFQASLDFPLQFSSHR